jgi:hypothetical protein
MRVAKTPFVEPLGRFVSALPVVAIRKTVATPNRTA